MKNTLAILGVFFIAGWVFLFIFGDSISQEKNIESNIAIIKASENTNDPVIKSQAEIQNAKLEKAQSDLAKQKEES